HRWDRRVHGTTREEPVAPPAIDTVSPGGQNRIDVRSGPRSAVRLRRSSSGRRSLARSVPLVPRRLDPGRPPSAGGGLLRRAAAGAGSDQRGDAEPGRPAIAPAGARGAMSDDTFEILFEQMIAQQRAKVLAVARTIDPRLTEDDILSPQDFPELIEDPR